MAGNQTLLVEVDWSSKSGSADSTIAFNETFDISLNGVNNFGADSNVRLVLSTAQTGLEKGNILYVISKSPALANGSLRINNIRVATPELLDTLNQQGGKGNFYLFVMEERADGSLVDFGSCRIKMTLGGYTEDTVLPENIEGLPTIKELQESVATINGSLVKAEAAAKRAETAADDLSEDIEDLRQTVSEAKAVSAAAKAESAEANATASKAESIAKGAAYSKIFDTEDEMKSWAAQQMALAEAERELKTGDNIYIRATDCPDYWWTGVDTGYSQLETGYVKIEVDTALDADSNNPIANSAVNRAILAEQSRASGVEAALKTNIDSVSTALNDALYHEKTFETTTADDINGMSCQKAKLSEVGFQGPAVKVSEIHLFHRRGGSTNGTVPLWLRFLRHDGTGWYVAYQATESVVLDSPNTTNGRHIVHFMEHRAGSEYIPTDEPVIICYAGSKDAAADSFVPFSAKLTNSATNLVFSGNTLPSVNANGGWPRQLAFYVKYKYRASFVEDLVAGENISIENGVISAAGGGSQWAVESNGTYERYLVHDAKLDDAGIRRGFAFAIEKSNSDNAFIIYEDGIYGLKKIPFGIVDQVAGKQDKLCAGAGIDITDGVIRVTGDVGGCQESLSVISAGNGLVVNAARPDNTSDAPYYFLAGSSLGDADPGTAFYVDACGAGVFINYHRYPFTKEMFSGGGSGGSPYLAIAACTSCAASAYDRSIAIGGYARADSPDSIVIGEESYSPGVRTVVIGNFSCSRYSDQILIGHGISDQLDMRAYVDNRGLSDAIMFRACNTSVFFTRDACNNYATMIGFKNSGGCYEERRIEDAFTGGGSSSGGDSYIKASTSGSPYDIPGCSSGIAIGPYVSIGNDVINGVAIGFCVSATRDVPVVIGAGRSAITVNSCYELCVGGNPVGGGGGSSNDAICVYDSEGYCALGIGADYVAIGNESIAYTDSVAVGAKTHAKEGEVAIGIYAGNDSKANGFITENSLFDVRRFRACSNKTLGNELFFATKDGKAVLGGEFSKVDGGDSGVTTDYCYFYLQDVADMLANGGGGGGSETSVMVYNDGFTTGIHTAEGGLTTGISYNNKNALRNANQIMTWLNGEQVSREQLVTTDTIAVYAKPAVETAIINGVANSYAYVGSFYQGQPVEGLCIDTVNSAVENGGKISIQFYDKAAGSSFGEVKAETFVPSLENFSALAERVVALETQLASMTQVVSEPDDEPI